LEPLKLINNKKEWLYLFIIFLLFFSFNSYKEYNNFKEFSSDEIYQTSGKVLNIFPDKDQTKNTNIAKIETANFTFFTSIPNTIELKQSNHIEFIVVSQKVTFYDFVKGFFAPTFNVELLPSNPTIIENINQTILAQHQNSLIGNLFNTLFFATSLNKELQNLCAIYGISHIVAISGFHLGIISFVLFFIFNLLYSPIHQKYFPYRNKKVDILILISVILFLYLLAINLVPSFLRSFLMFLFGLFLLRSNIKLFSFISLFLVILIIIALYPKLLFSLSLWFSVAGVFYIFLYIQYFNTLNKYLSFLLFNFWIFFAINPITHFFFGTTSIIQLLSPLITIGFIIFYPIELFLHLIGYGDILDNLIYIWINTNPSSMIFLTPTFIFIGHIIISFLAVQYRIWFYVLNLDILIFNSYLYYFIYYG
jgi:competence protein ComEC